MFGFLSKTAPELEVQQLPISFSPSDIQDLFTHFDALGLSSSDSTHQVRGLIPSKSGRGVVQVPSSIEKIQVALEQGTGRILLRQIIDECDLDESIFAQSVLPPNIISSADGSELLTRSEQQRILKSLHDASIHGFVDGKNFCSEERISHRSLEQLIQMQKKEHKSDQMSKILDEDSQIEYYYHSEVIQSMISVLQDLVTESQHLHRPQMLKSDHLFGLPSSMFLKVVGKLLNDLLIPGSFQLHGKAVQFLPDSYLVAQKQIAFQDLLNGTTQHAPRDQVMTSDEAIPDSALAKLIVAPPLLISRVALERLIEPHLLALERMPFATNDLLKEFPESSHSAVFATIKETCSGHMMNGSWVLHAKWYARMKEELIASSQRQAQRIWYSEDETLQQKMSPRSSLKGVDSIIYADFAKITNRDDNPVLDSIWQQPAVLLGAADDDKEAKSFKELALASYASVWTALESSMDADFLDLWSSKIVNPIRLHHKALLTMPAGSLKQQLEELLSTYIAQDLVPATARRAKSKGLLRQSSLKLNKRIPKLEETLKQLDSIQIIVEELERFGDKVGVVNCTENEMRTQQQKFTSDMVKAMSKDHDGPRLFLCLLIILYASKYPGVLYATGRFAPKIFKALQTEIPDALAANLARWKDAIKSGGITNDMRSEIRAAAAQAHSGSLSKEKFTSGMQLSAQVAGGDEMIV